jgi:hypothetical protein
MPSFFLHLSKSSIYLFGVIFLISCQTSSPKTSSQSSATSLSPTTLLPTNTPFPSPTKHITLTPTQVPIETLTPTVTYIPYLNSPALANFLITRDDILSPEVQDWDFIPGIIDTFLKEGSIYIKDKSYEIKIACPIECTKQSWTQSEFERVYRHLEITMIRMKDEQEASEKASELYKSLNPYGDEYGIDEYEWINAPTQNSHIGFSDWNRSYVLTTSTGTIALMIVSHPSPYSDDGLTEVSLMVGFANLQFYKLKNANLIP